MLKFGLLDLVARIAEDLRTPVARDLAPARELPVLPVADVLLDAGFELDEGLLARRGVSRVSLGTTSS